MPIIRRKDIRQMSSGQRNEKITELQTELSRLRTMVKAGGSIDNPSRIRELRRTIARILTIENEEKRKRMGERAREIVEKKFSWETIAHRFILMYERFARSR